MVVKVKAPCSQRRHLTALRLSTAVLDSVSSLWEDSELAPVRPVGIMDDGPLKRTVWFRWWEYQSRKSIVSQAQIACVPIRCYRPKR